MIIMKKEDCILCYGSGFVEPYPYHRREKCDHRYDAGVMEARLHKLRGDEVAIVAEIESIERAIRTGEPEFGKKM